jgi:hypothetical protein
MAERSSAHTINIRPAVSVYATYRRLSYTPWYAIAEFVDNSTQNYYDHRAKLLAAFKKEGDAGRLVVRVSYDSDRNTLEIRDNAHGMDLGELARAVVLDSPPPIRSGRCEYGMGLKTAACWFGASWTIKTKRLGTTRVLVARVHVPDLVEKLLDEIDVTEELAAHDEHYTIITIEGLYKPIRGRTTGRIRDQLGSMYREDLRSGEIEILWNGQAVEFENAPILEEVIDGGPPTVWRKDVSFEVPWEPSGESFHVRGWIGIRTPGSQRDAGFALLRRGRVVIGGPGDGYKPAEVFGQGNTFRSQRLIGELHMDGWPVTQAKDAFDWSGGLEDEFIDELKHVCQDYMEKAEDYRQPGRPVTRTEMQQASEKTQQVLSSPSFTAALAQDLAMPEPPKSQETDKADAAKLRSVSDGPVVFRVPIAPDEWEFRLHWQDQLSDAHWMSVEYPNDTVTDIFLNMAHPFFARYLDDKGFLELLQKFVLALALAERMSRRLSRNGTITPGDFRNYMNRVLRYAADIEADYGS